MLEKIVSKVAMVGICVAGTYLVASGLYWSTVSIVDDIQLRKERRKLKRKFDKALKHNAENMAKVIQEEAQHADA